MLTYMDHTHGLHGATSKVFCNYLSYFRRDTITSMSGFLPCSEVFTVRHVKQYQMLSWAAVESVSLRGSCY